MPTLFSFWSLLQVYMITYQECFILYMIEQDMREGDL